MCAVLQSLSLAASLTTTDVTGTTGTMASRCMREKLRPSTGRVAASSLAQRFHCRLTICRHSAGRSVLILSFIQCDLSLLCQLRDSMAEFSGDSANPSLPGQQQRGKKTKKRNTTLFHVGTTDDDLAADATTSAAASGSGSAPPVNASMNPPTSPVRRSRRLRRGSRVAPPAPPPSPLVRTRTRSETLRVSIGAGGLLTPEHQQLADQAGSSAVTANPDAATLPRQMDIEDLESVAVTSDSMSFTNEHSLSLRSRRVDRIGGAGACIEDLNRAFELQDTKIRSMSSPSLASQRATRASAARLRPNLNRAKSSFGSMDPDIVMEENPSE